MMTVRVGWLIAEWLRHLSKNRTSQKACFPSFFFPFKKIVFVCVLLSIFGGKGREEWEGGGGSNFSCFLLSHVLKFVGLYQLYT